ncbi:MAG: hypothetical protein E6K78_01305 [Candidatus Eisenbacteria bacterium]|uniref:DNA repair protein RecN n=1 Tax=Eiseniibacteriota bacterium TaxID=2212470 RepID=A0A538TY12_UNCEI|nr:MAG: hypothetical protein E6K78_01305 [Candidatus Eisenbacteria bacterium]
MLERLTIRDLAVVERAEVTFGPGLNAVTGETGAGKSLTWWWGSGPMPTWYVKARRRRWWRPSSI